MKYKITFESDTELSQDQLSSIVGKLAGAISSENLPSFAVTNFEAKEVKSRAK